MLFEVASGGMIYIPSFTEIDSDVQELLWDTQAHTHPCARSPR
jgi:hypothetical protein